jgi:hypothetical protein
MAINMLERLWVQQDREKVSVASSENALILRGMDEEFHNLCSFSQETRLGVCHSINKYRIFVRTPLLNHSLGRSREKCGDKTGSLFYLKTIVCHFPPLLWAVGSVGCVATMNGATGRANL